MIGRRVADRALQLLSVVALVVIGTVVLLRLLPGDPVATILGSKAPAEARAALSSQLGLDRPVLDQIGRQVIDLASGDLGTSLLRPGSSVVSIVGSAFGVTAALVAATLLLGLLLGVPLGLIAGLTRSRVLDAVIRNSLIVMLATPPFFVGLVAILVVAIRLGAAPAGGWGAGWPANLEYVWLPALSLCTFLVPTIARAVRRATRDVLDDQHIHAAVARGLPTRTIVLRHVLPNSLLPVVTLVGFNAATLISGAVVTEAVFGLPGIGSELLAGVAGRDFPVVQGIALVTAISVVGLSITTDIVSELIDPRVRRR